MTRRRNWKDWIEGNPIKILCGVAVAACTATAGVANYFNEKEIKIEQESAATQLSQAKSELSNQLHELQTRLLSIERRVGTESFLDVSALTVTPNQIRELRENFIYNEKIHAYISLPSSSSWKFMETDELGLGRMLSGASEESDQGTGAITQLFKQQKVFLWRGEEQLKLGDTSTSTSVLFPYVAIEPVNNQELYRMMDKMPDVLGEVQSSERVLNALAEKLDSELSGQSEKTKTPDRTPSANQEKTNTSTEKVVEKLASVYNSDITSLFLSSAILQGFFLSMNVPGSTFRVLDAEKKGNVFYLHTQTVFPASDKTQTVYWDREMICIGNRDSTYIVSTSAPSLDQRPLAGPWITAWLAGLRIPLE